MFDISLNFWILTTMQKQQTKCLTESIQEISEFLELVFGVLYSKSRVRTGFHEITFYCFREHLTHCPSGRIRLNCFFFCVYRFLHDEQGLHVEIRSVTTNFTFKWSAAKQPIHISWLCTCECTTLRAHTHTRKKITINKISMRIKSLVVFS